MVLERGMQFRFGRLVRNFADRAVDICPARTNGCKGRLRVCRSRGADLRDGRGW